MGRLGRQDWQERRGIEERWACQDRLEKRDQTVTQGHQVKADPQGHQEIQEPPGLVDPSAPEDPKADGVREGLTVQQGTQEERARRVLMVLQEKWVSQEIRGRSESRGKLDLEGSLVSKAPLDRQETRE